MKIWQQIVPESWAVVSFLEQNREINSDAITEGFSTYAEYAKCYVKELCDFGTLEHCWAVDLDESHHNQAFFEYSDWFALVRLSGVFQQAS